MRDNGLNNSSPQRVQMSFRRSAGTVGSGMNLAELSDHPSHDDRRPEPPPRPPPVGASALLNSSFAGEPECFGNLPRRIVPPHIGLQLAGIPRQIVRDLVACHLASSLAALGSGYLVAMPCLVRARCKPVGALKRATLVLVPSAVNNGPTGFPALRRLLPQRLPQLVAAPADFIQIVDFVGALGGDSNPRPPDSKSGALSS